jgi:hypothetical protein
VSQDTTPNKKPMTELTDEKLTIFVSKMQEAVTNLRAIDPALLTEDEKHEHEFALMHACNLGLFLSLEQLRRLNQKIDEGKQTQQGEE